MQKIKIPYELQKMNSLFEEAGYEAYLVGGAVRDEIMGKGAHDWDVATNARPEEVIKIFRRVIPTGIKHGTVTVHFMKRAIEVTTFRTESDYSDGRHPDKVEYAGRIEEDLSRRDFTMNAMAASLKDGHIVDPYGSAATFTMPDKDVELSYRFKAKTKAALGKIGDVALNDGSFVDIDNVDKMNSNQKNNAYAVIFDVANKKGVEKNLGSGVKNVWCYEETGDLFGNKSIAGSKTDGAQNTKDVLAKDGYGVFIIAKTANTNSFGGKSDWYLPASHELYALFSNVQTINRALAVINTEGRKFEDNAAYWSSTAQTGEAMTGNQAYIMDTDLKHDNGDAYGEDGFALSKTTICRVCVIRAFN